jgi:[CysO sulfur-carrier protein]-S-L-cysteine hydrolase
MRLSRSQWQQLVDHAVREAPNECCGYLRAREGRVEDVTEAENSRRSPYGYELDGPALLRVNELDDEGWEIGVYHSHPRSPAEPSQTDINLATYPHWTYLIVSLADASAPIVRAWRIDDDDVREESVEIDGR